MKNLNLLSLLILSLLGSNLSQAQVFLNDGTEVYHGSFALTLIDADTDEDITPIYPHDALDTTVIKTENLNIRANVVEGFKGSVEFQLEGPVNLTRTENQAPYALFKNEGSDYLAGSLPMGKYTLTLKAYSGKRRRGQLLESKTFRFDRVEIFNAPIFLVEYINGERNVIANITGDPGEFDLGDITHKSIHFEGIPSGGSLDHMFMEIYGNFDDEWITYDDYDPPFNQYPTQWLDGFRDGSVVYYNFTPSIISKTKEGGYIFHRTGQRTSGVVKLLGSWITNGPLKILDINEENKVEKFVQKTKTRFFSSAAELFDLNTFSSPEANFNLLYCPRVNNFGSKVELSIGSVEFQLEGPINMHKIDNEPPFVLVGEDTTTAEGIPWPEGEYILTVTAYSEKNAQGSSTRANIRRFITYQGGGDLSLSKTIDYDADTDTPLNGSYSVDFGTRFDLEALPSPEQSPQSVRFILFTLDYSSGLYTLVEDRVENYAPFVLFGNNGSDFKGRVLETGQYNLFIIPYSKKNAKGVAGEIFLDGFEIRYNPSSSNVLSTSLESKSNQDISQISPSFDVNIFPNQTDGLIQLEPSQEVNSYSPASIQIYNQFGQLMLRQNLDEPQSQLDLSKLKEGIYHFIYTQRGQQIHKRIVIKK